MRAPGEPGDRFGRAISQRPGDYAATQLGWISTLRFPFF
jgi:hypothetical protein